MMQNVENLSINTFQGFKNLLNQTRGSIIITNPEDLCMKSIEFLYQYYLQFGKIFFLSQSSKFILSKPQVQILQKQKYRCPQEASVTIQFLINLLQKALLQNVIESLSLTQNIFQFPLGQWSKFTKSPCFQNLKQLFTKKYKKCQQQQEFILKKRKVCQKCKKIIVEITTQVQKYCPLNKFMKKYNEVLFQILFLLDKSLKKQDSDLWRIVTFLIYTMVITTIHASKTFQQDVHQLLRQLSPQIPQNDFRYFNFDVYYKCITQLNASKLCKHYKNMCSQFQLKKK